MKELTDIETRWLEAFAKTHDFFASFLLHYKLKNLNLSSNDLVEIPDSIGELVMLKDLNLNNNKLKSLPECIKNLTCLETLKLKANFWISIPESIEKLKEQGLQIIL